MPMQVAQADSTRVTVLVRTATKNKDGKWEYETAGSFNVTGGTAEQALALCRRAFTAQPKE